MDFWDLTKVLLRRWYVAAPLLMLTVFAAYRTASTVRPDYVATSYVQIVPPTAPEEPETTPRKKPSGPLNPWLQLGFNALGQAAVLTVQDSAVLAQLKAQGLTDSVVVTLDDRNPVITIQAVSTSKNQALATSEEVVKRVSASVQELQAEYGAKKDSFATSRRLDQGNNVEEANSKVKRALVAVAGAGILFSVALTIGADALLRRRRKPSDAEPPAAAAADPAPEQPRAPADGHESAPSGRRYLSSTFGTDSGGDTTLLNPGEKTTVLRVPGEATIVLPAPGGKPREDDLDTAHNGKEVRP